MLSSGASLESRRFGGRSLSGERQSPGSALPHKGKSFGIGADAEMPDVLTGVWFGSLAYVIEYISGLTLGSRLIPCY